MINKKKTKKNSGLSRTASGNPAIGKETCQKIHGYDTNALYLWANGQDMPVGIFVPFERSFLIVFQGDQ